jgi:hypothetical protein
LTSILDNVTLNTKVYMTQDSEVEAPPVSQYENPLVKVTNCLKDLAEKEKGIASNEDPRNNHERVARDLDEIAKQLDDQMKRIATIVREPMTLVRGNNAVLINGPEVASTILTLKGQAGDNLQEGDLSKIIGLIEIAQGRKDGNWGRIAGVQNIPVAEAGALLVDLGALPQGKDLAVEFQGTTGDKITNERTFVSGHWERDESRRYSTIVPGANVEVRAMTTENPNGSVDYRRSSYQVSLGVTSGFIVNSLAPEFVNQSTR